MTIESNRVSGQPSAIAIVSGESGAEMVPNTGGPGSAPTSSPKCDSRERPALWKNCRGWIKLPWMACHSWRYLYKVNRQKMIVFRVRRCVHCKCEEVLMGWGTMHEDWRQAPGPWRWDFEKEWYENTVETEDWYNLLYHDAVVRRRWGVEPT